MKLLNKQNTFKLRNLINNMTDKLVKEIVKGVVEDTPKGVVKPTEDLKKARKEITKETLTAIKLILKKGKLYDTIFPTDVTVSLNKTTDVEIDFHSDFRIMPKIREFKIKDQGNFDINNPERSIDEFGEKINNNSVIFERILHEKIILKPTFAVDTGILLINMALSNPEANIDKGKIKEKLNNFIKELK